MERAPGLVRDASKAAIEGIGQLAGEGKESMEVKFDLSEADLVNLPMRFGSQITLRLRGGKEVTHKIDIPAGSAGRDESETKGKVRKKFRQAATPLLDEQKVKKAIELVDDLENLDDLSDLTAALCAD